MQDAEQFKSVIKTRDAQFSQSQTDYTKEQ